MFRFLSLILCGAHFFGRIQPNHGYLDRLVLRPFLPPLCAAFFACCVRRIIHRSSCSNSTSFIMCRSRKSGLSNKYAVTCSGNRSENKNIQIRMWKHANQLDQCTFVYYVSSFEMRTHFDFGESEIVFLFANNRTAKYQYQFQFKSIASDHRNEIQYLMSSLFELHFHIRINQIKTELITNFNQNNARNSFLLAFCLLHSIHCECLFVVIAQIRILWSSFWFVICAAVRAARGS